MPPRVNSRAKRRSSNRPDDQSGPVPGPGSATRMPSAARRPRQPSSGWIFRPPVNRRRSSSDALKMSRASEFALGQVRSGCRREDRQGRRGVRRSHRARSSAAMSLEAFSAPRPAAWLALAAESRPSAPPGGGGPPPGSGRSRSDADGPQRWLGPDPPHRDALAPRQQGAAQDDPEPADRPSLADSHGLFISRGPGASVATARSSR